MKKFIVMILAAACVAAAVPALAGDFSVSGTYELESIYFTSDKDILSDAVPTGFTTTDKYNDAYYQNDFELITNYTQGPVTATIDWEIVDSNAKTLAGHTVARSNDGPDDIVDNYYITWKASDNITFKTGEYNLDWGNKIAVYKQGGYNLALTHAMDAVDLGLTIGQKVESNYQKSADEVVDADNTQYLLSAAFKKAGPFTKANLYLLYDMRDKNLAGDGSSHTATLIAGEYAVPAGPVALSGEFGFFGGEVSDAAKAEGNYLLVVAGLKDLVKFDLNTTIFMSSDKMFLGYKEKWSPMLIFGGYDLNLLNETNGNTTFLKIDGSYAVNDKLSVGGAIMPYAKATKKNVDWNGYTLVADETDLGTEIDATYSYKFADNVVLNGGLGMFSAGDAFGGEGSVTALYNKLTFKF